MKKSKFFVIILMSGCVCGVGKSAAGKRRADMGRNLAMKNNFSQQEEGQFRAFRKLPPFAERLNEL